jgi:DNA gyrase/topoisomerase IV subunit A
LTELVEKQKVEICECRLHPICNIEQKRFETIEAELESLRQILRQQKEQVEALSQLVLEFFEKLQDEA